MLVMAHATPLYQAYIKVLVTYNKFPGVCAQPPLSLFSASQQTRGAHRLLAHMRSHMSVKTQEDPLNLHIFHLDMLVTKTKSNKDLRWPLLELLKSSKILFTV